MRDSRGPTRNRFGGASLLACVLLGCWGGPAGSGGAVFEPLFEEATARAGLDDSPEIWPDGQYRIPELSGSGIALFDFDGDGDLDLYQVRHPPPPTADAPAPNRLYRQDPNGRLVDVPGAAGLDDPGYGNGVALGDADNDGDLDVFIANLGADALYRNGGDASFRNVTAEAGIAETEWSTAAAFFDPDRDGDLDLYVAHYLKDDPTRTCTTTLGEPRDYCGPSRYQSVSDLFLRNRGDGRFEDASKAAGIADTRPGFGVVCLDLTGDGWQDVFVANDMQPNLLWVNRQDGTFVDRALEMGAAVNGAGRPQAGMGVAAGDVDGDTHLDLFVTNLSEQTNTLYVGQKGPGGMAFTDRSASSGLGAPSWPFTTWGCGMHDFDHDGDLDIAVVNSRIARGPVRPGARAGGFWNPYAEPNQLFLNQGSGRFVDSLSASGDFAARVEVTRALAFGDLDRDGDLDLVTGGIGTRLRIYRNRGAWPGRHWLAVRARTGRRDALGALVTIEAGGKRRLQPVLSAYSFQCAQEPIAHFGLGSVARVDRIEVVWPDGAAEEFPGREADQAVTLVQGTGTALR